MAGALATAGVDHLDIGGAGSIASATISDVQASALVAAGLDFAGADTITVQAGAAGTHLSTSLTSLTALGVDAVAASAGQTGLNLDLGGDGGLNALDAGNLPTFITDGFSDASLDVTLNVNAGDLIGADLTTLAGALATAGVDHLDIGGYGAIESATISEVQAGALVAAGLDFAHTDNISVTAAGTHLSTSLESLQQLGVDNVAVAAGVTQLVVGLGASGIHASDLPQFDVAQSDAALNVVLEIGDADIAQTSDLGQLMGIDLLTGVAQPELYGELVAALQASGIDQVLIDATNSVSIEDGLMASLANAGMLEVLPATELVLDATASGNAVETTLSEMSNLGVDLVKLANLGSDTPVYIDLGIENGAITEAKLTELLSLLDGDSNPATGIFSGSSHVGLVVDQATAEVIANTSGALLKLVELGFTELDVLDATPTFLSDLENAPIEVKLIGSDVDPFTHQSLV